MNTPLADNIVSVFSTRMDALGNYRYLLFDISATENDDAFGNTFYSEIDVVPSGTAAAGAPTAVQPLTFNIEADGEIRGHDRYQRNP